MQFASRKDGVFSVLVYGINFCLLGLIAFQFYFEFPNFWVACLVITPILFIVLLLFWMFYSTSYNLSDGSLYYKSGPIKGQIAINSITSIAVGETLWVGLKPATARKGLIIKYNRFDELYISPDSNTSFVQKIKELNPEIAVSGA